MIEVYCHTNLDLWNESWPSKLPCRPMVGDIIQSETAHNMIINPGVGGRSSYEFHLELEVVSVRFASDKHGIYNLEVELHDRKFLARSITAFYDWYAPKVGKTKSYFI